LISSIASTTPGAGPLELFCVEVQIRFSQPRRERFPMAAPMPDEAK
jgi:hypothetical protein